MVRNFQQKRGWRNIVQAKPVLALFGILILFFAWNILGFWNKMQETAKNKKIAEENVVSLEQREKALSSEINNLNTEQGKEKLFRENFGLAKDGEDMIVIVEDKNPPPAPKTTPNGFFSWLGSLFK